MARRKLTAKFKAKVVLEALTEKRGQLLSIKRKANGE